MPTAPMTMLDAVDDTDGVDLVQTGSSVLPGAVIVACLALTGVIVASASRDAHITSCTRSSRSGEIPMTAHET